MKISQLFVDIAATGVIVLAVSLGVTYLYSYSVDGVGSVDWQTSFRLAFTIGIALPVVHQREARSSMRRHVH